MTFIFYNTKGDHILSFEILEDPGSEPQNIKGDDSWFNFEFQPPSKQLGRKIGYKESPSYWAGALQDCYNTKDSPLSLHIKAEPNHKEDELSESQNHYTQQGGFENEPEKERGEKTSFERSEKAKEILQKSQLNTPEEIDSTTSQKNFNIPDKIPLFKAKQIAKEQEERAIKAEAESAHLSKRVRELEIFIKDYGLNETLNQSLINKELKLEYDQLKTRVEEEKERMKEEIIMIEKSIERSKEYAEKDIQEKISRMELELEKSTEELERISKKIVETRDEEILQEVGIYKYKHPLANSGLYKKEHSNIKSRIKKYNGKDTPAVTVETNWLINDSEQEGKRFVRNFSKLLLRAYNTEADFLGSKMTPTGLESSKKRLSITFERINKLGMPMGMQISRAYHGLRIYELEIIADFKQRKAEEKEADKEQRRIIKEEEKARAELEAERKRLEDKLLKERAHYENALRSIEESSEEEKEKKQSERDAIMKTIEDIEKGIKDVDYRVANAKAGYVYVISNIGSFGEGIIKIGMTRRLEPMNRVKELGDASVPFKFDVHALFFSEDAVFVEGELHKKFADRRINRVNLRKEYFQATPEEVHRALLEMAGAGRLPVGVDGESGMIEKEIQIGGKTQKLIGSVLEYEEIPEASEYRQSLNDLKAAGVDMSKIIRPV